MMNYTEYLAYLDDAAHLPGADYFLSEYGCPPSCRYSAENIIKMCHIIYAAAHRDFAALVETAGAKSVRAFALKFNVPQQSAQGWAAGSHKAPDYLIELIGYAMIAELPEENERCD